MPHGSRRVAGGLGVLSDGSSARGLVAMNRELDGVEWTAGDAPPIRSAYMEWVRSAWEPEQMATWMLHETLKRHSVIALPGNESAC